jgi:hypothetical protein
VIGPQVSEELRHLLLALLPTGRRFPVRASELASELGVSTRTVGGLVEDLIGEGFLIGSACNPEAPGYFLCADLEDLEAGTAHLMSRARAMFARVAQMRRLARERFDEPEVLQQLFDFGEAELSA